jgi:uncharacterized protein (TIGR02453 family)
MPAKFTGFPAEGLAFLRQLKRNNNREWFQQRKHVYDEKLRAPMEALIEALNAQLATIAPDYVTEPKKAIYRIYRDTRFSPNKEPYKTHIAAIFTRRSMPKHEAGAFYFHVSPDEIVAAGGVYMPGAAALLRLRTHIAANHSELAAILKSARRLAGELHGASLTRPPKGFPPGHPAIELLKRKQWYFDLALPPAAAAKPSFPRELFKRFAAMLPAVEFFNRALAPKRALL